MRESNSTLPCVRDRLVVIYKSANKGTHNSFNRKYTDFTHGTYARGLSADNQYHLSPTSGTVMVSTNAILARLMQVQNIKRAA